MDKNTDNNTKNCEEGDGLDILASHERLYHPDNFEMLQAISTLDRSGDNKQSNKIFTKSVCVYYFISTKVSRFFDK